MQNTESHSSTMPQISRLAAVLAALVACAACDGPDTPFPSPARDAENILRTVLEYRLSVEDSVHLERRLLPADTFNFMPPFWEGHDALPASAALVEIAAKLPGVTFAPLRRTRADTGWVLSLSHPIVLGDNAVAYWADSHLEPSSREGYGYEYWAAFFRIELVRAGDGWRIANVANWGSEN